MIFGLYLSILVFLLFNTCSTKTLRWVIRVIRKKLNLSKYGDVILNSMNQTVTSLFGVDLDFEYYEDVIIFLAFIFTFCSEQTVRKDNCMRTIFIAVMVIFSKVLFWKILDNSYHKSSFSTVTKYIDNIILKETLQLQILWTWLNIRANSFIKTWVNIME